MLLVYKRKWSKVLIATYIFENISSVHSPRPNKAWTYARGTGANLEYGPMDLFQTFPGIKFQDTEIIVIIPHT